MHPELCLIDYRNRERAIEVAAERRRAHAARSSSSRPTGGLRRRLGRALHRR
ncbi:hypothetical protein J1G42_03420 [Cellulomonas sp. zg-ZUI222]|uniref:Uncharacterized protein n=1 Tax=Cellulomonas wangleii TaxID=2816956 RepID=A0ABX8D3G5_9CELL|nr:MULTISPECIES: hypothetical protein [Cellulomonas]MBO0899020.1 hypothetical protein [Cellulomonas sp. zg-ZUI22]MBO0919874.1 hypothetical protein [Cellulomonas wangleii]MBO0923697.1 hypothetical protein [Cellulomonas wangleii]MBO0923979.1 hypothetical protein [Cellulomonas wangleii]QVI62010.1 hypothetical protein KG103_16575 [Cellulomonas wangleii]